MIMGTDRELFFNLSKRKIKPYPFKVIVIFSM